MKGLDVKICDYMMSFAQSETSNKILPTLDKKIVTRIPILFASYEPHCLLTASLSPSPVRPTRLRVDRLSVWPQHHLEHADVPAEHSTGHLLHPHPGLPHLRLCPGGQLQLHQHRPQHRHSQCHHRSVVLLHLSCSHSLGFSCVFNSL